MILLLVLHGEIPTKLAQIDHDGDEVKSMTVPHASPLPPRVAQRLSMQGNGGSGIDWTGSGNSKGFDIIGGNAGKKSGANSSPGFQDSGLGFEIPLGSKVEKKGNELNPKTEGDPELVLAELAFSNPMEMPKIIERNLPYLDDTFFKFVDNKIKNSPDKDEVETLTLLREAVVDLKKQITGAIAKVRHSRGLCVGFRVLIFRLPSF